MSLFHKIEISINNLNILDSQIAYNTLFLILSDNRVLYSDFNILCEFLSKKFNQPEIKVLSGHNFYSNFNVLDRSIDYNEISHLFQEFSHIDSFPVDSVIWNRKLIIACEDELKSINLENPKSYSRFYTEKYPYSISNITKSKYFTFFSLPNEGLFAVDNSFDKITYAKKIISGPSISSIITSNYLLNISEGYVPKIYNKNPQTKTINELSDSLKLPTNKLINSKVLEEMDSGMDYYFKEGNILYLQLNNKITLKISNDKITSGTNKYAAEFNNHQNSNNSELSFNPISIYSHKLGYVAEYFDECYFIPFYNSRNPIKDLLFSNEINQVRTFPTSSNYNNLITLATPQELKIIGIYENSEPKLRPKSIYETTPIKDYEEKLIQTSGFRIKRTPVRKKEKRYKQICS